MSGFWAFFRSEAVDLSISLNGRKMDGGKETVTGRGGPQRKIVCVAVLSGLLLTSIHPLHLSFALTRYGSVRVPDGNWDGDEWNKFKYDGASGSRNAVFNSNIL